jgi:hypothetical protein
MLLVIDNFVTNAEAVRESALQAGFGTWRPGKGELGASFYDGVSFWGDHASLFKALHQHLGRQIIPSSMFFRVTNPSMERALIHSDREYGDNTAIVYLSESQWSGTGFYRHRETGMTDMPPINELRKDPPFLDRIRQQMLDASDKDWDMYQFVEAKFNRCVVFDAPKIHCRLPKNGYGEEIEDSRMVWVAHFGVAH